MTIKEVTVDRTNDSGQFAKNGDNWLVAIRFSNGKKFGFEIKPEMDAVEICTELVKFANLLLVNLVNK